MGRRAKNKQSPPQPLEPESLSGPKLAKRKAENDGSVPSRPNKKLKDVSNKAKHQSASNPSVSKPKGKIRQAKDAKKNQVRSVESEGGSGWEDMEDGEADLKTQAK